MDYYVPIFNIILLIFFYKCVISSSKLKGSIYFIYFLIVLVLYWAYNYNNEYKNGDIKKFSLDVYKIPDYNVKMNPIQTEYYNPHFKKNMDLTLKDFYITGSYKSYLVGGETFGLCSFDSIKNIIQKGARLLNLDVFSNTPNNYDTSAFPVVRCERLMPHYGTSLDFVDCCKIINDKAWENTNYPMILYLKFDKSAKNNKFVKRKIGNTLFKIFNNKFVDKKYGFRRLNIGNIKIKDALNKIIIVTNNYPNNGVLDEITNATVGGENQTVKLHKYTQSNLTNGLIASYNQGELDDMIDVNKKNFSILEPQNIYSIMNIKNQKSDLINPNIDQLHKYGIQIVCMNYQLYNDNMKKYINKFKNSSFILKPDEQRYIPDKKVETVKNKEVTFSEKRMVIPGWADIKY